MAISPLARLRELGGEPPFTVFISAIILTMICLLVKVRSAHPFHLLSALLWDR